ncbi:MAG: hypothetical protein ABI783_03225 [Actinomycetota bacterium]
MVVASLALLVALTGTSVAAVSQLVPRNSVGTPQLKKDAVTSAKVKNNSLLSADFKLGQIPAGPAGPSGPTGAAGAAGPAGPAGVVTRLTAVANASGSLARSQGTTSAGRVGLGLYEVIFNQDVTGCTYVATIGNPTAGAALPTGHAVVVPRSGNANGVGVATFDAAGTLADRPFHLIVVC